ncbi:MAG: LacI family DNA-binding transcriptional regulator [Verrucomicrobiota bacterium]
MNKIGKATVTQQMVADAVGVHLSTVSLALRNDSRLPEATRNKIRAVAQKLGYAPNPLVSLLMSRVRRRNAGYRGTLGYLHTVPTDTPKLGGHVHRNFVGGARKRAAALGYNLDELFLSDDSMSPRRIVRTLQARSIAGLVIEHTPTALCPGRKLPFDISPFAVATLCVPLAEPLHYVANDQYMRAILAARELLALGYRRLGLVVVGTFDSAMAHRCSAGFWAVQEYIEGIERIPILRIKDTEERAFRAWLDRYKPDAILTTNAIVPEFIAAAGLRVPHDIGWATLDWIPEHKPAAGVYGNSEHTGAAAVDLVVSQLHRGESGRPDHAMHYLVAGSWMPGKTIKKVGPPLDLETSFFADLGRV